jgi:hypothetical protein
MDVKSLRSLLEASQTSSRTKIVVVSACHSEEAGKTFIEAGELSHGSLVDVSRTMTCMKCILNNLYTSQFY